MFLIRVPKEMEGFLTPWHDHFIGGVQILPPRNPKEVLVNGALGDATNQVAESAILYLVTYSVEYPFDRTISCYNFIEQ